MGTFLNNGEVCNPYSKSDHQMTDFTPVSLLEVLLSRMGHSEPMRASHDVAMSMIQLSDQLNAFQALSKPLNNPSYKTSMGLNVTMSPNRFLFLASRTPPIDPQKVQLLKEAMENGVRFSNPYLVIRADTNQTVSHDGRHRSAALAQDGVSTIPVTLFFVEPKDMGGWLKMVQVMPPVGYSQQMIKQQANGM